MLLRTIAFLLGIITLSYQSELPPSEIIYSLILIVPLLLFKKRYITVFFWFCGGFIWATFFAQQLLDDRLSPELEGKELLITGVVSSLPENYGRHIGFEFSLDNFIYNNTRYNSPQKIKLNWYGKSPEIIPGDYWQLLVRLKKPFSYQNPGGFDYESWMFQNGIDAKGYVRQSEKNKKLETTSIKFIFTRTRYFIKQKILSLEQSKYRSIILALLIGDKSEISQEQWTVFRKTGTSHLIAISGLHIGLIAGLVFFLSRWLWGFYYTGVEIIPSPKFAAILAIISAILYSAMAGFSLPTQRALIMLCVLMISILLDIRIQSWKILAIALFLVLLLSPFAVMNPGFWLSFIAVAIILYFSQKKPVKENNLNSKLLKWSIFQFVIGLGLMPIVLLFFNESSLVSPLANFVVIPIFSLVIVPTVFIAGCLLFIIPFISEILFYLTTLVLGIVWSLLEFLAGLNFATFQLNHLSMTAFLLSSFGIALIFMPKYFPTKKLAFIFFLPLFFVKFNKPDFGAAQVTLLDVGQGLSAVVQTQNHVLVYDTGPRYSNSFNTGKTVVIPYLNTKGISVIDMLVVSHGDNDHIGGVRSVVEFKHVKKIITSVPAKVNSILKSHDQLIKIDYCNTDMHWIWDGVEFEIIHPHPLSKLTKNNASCVLRITPMRTNPAFQNRTNSVLLTGDIESEAEFEIIDNQELEIKSTVMIAPHHGSKTSSTLDFINKVQPEYILYPIGYKNRYHFPAQSVSDRYKAIGAAEYSTSKYGAITFNLDSSITKKPELYRVSHRRFWHN